MVRARLVNHHAQPSAHAHVKDTNHTLRLLDEFEFSGSLNFLFTMDVKSLYTSIPHTGSLAALKHYLDLRQT